MSLHIAKHFSRPLALASAAFLIHIGAATAADSTGDLLGQMNALLAGTTPAYSAPQSGPRGATAKNPTANAQEFVTQVLLGTTGSRLESTATTARSGIARISSENESGVRLVSYGNGNTQVAVVQRLLLGQHHASDAS
jgi:hypothetical protein